ncbi:hypothetical protein, partial [Dysosmobacter sp.]|uniref:hypothetical protein n=1 Tax=Dysosmobacter sp. TaxID=2591382 RepID=UPI003AF1B0F9
CLRRVLQDTPEAVGRKGLFALLPIFSVLCKSSENGLSGEKRLFRHAEACVENHARLPCLISVYLMTT